MLLNSEVNFTHWKDRDQMEKKKVGMWSSFKPEDSWKLLELPGS